MKAKYNVILIIILCGVVLFGIIFAGRVAFSQKTKTNVITLEEYQAYERYGIQLKDGEDVYSYLETTFPAGSGTPTGGEEFFTDSIALQQLQEDLPEVYAVLNCSYTLQDGGQQPHYTIDYVTAEGERILLKYAQDGYAQKQIRTGDRIITVDNQLRETVKNVK